MIVRRGNGQIQMSQEHVDDSQPHERHCMWYWVYRRPLRMRVESYLSVDQKGKVDVRSHPRLEMPRARHFSSGISSVK